LVDAAIPDGDKLRFVVGFIGPVGCFLRVDGFAMVVVTFTPGECGGFGITLMPGVVTGTRVGAG
jgi:hypothetical protein